MCFHGNWAKKNFFFLKKLFKMADSKNLGFSKSAILKNSFHGLVLGLVGLIDAKGIDVVQPM